MDAAVDDLPMSNSIIEQARRAQRQSLVLHARTLQILAEVTETVAAAGRAGSISRVDKLVVEVQGLRRAMEHRAEIEQAKGIVMANLGCGPDEAFDILRRQSQHENRRLREIAHELVAITSRGRGVPARPG
ncbi:MAG: hypothetical protein RLZZ362_702 [Actinomycetota bacterium]|jgi:AmiR/NasT family two-component response regulator